MNDAPAKPADELKPKELKVLKPEVQLSAARYSPCGKILAAPGYDGRIRRWDASTDDYQERAAVGGHQGWCTSLVYAAEELAVSADSWGKIAAWTYTAEQPPTKWTIERAHDGWVRELAISPDGKTLASCGMDKRVRLWSAIDGSKLADLDGLADVYCVRFAPDGKSLYTGDDRGIVRRRGLDGAVQREFNAAELYSLSRLQDVGGVRCLAPDPAGKRVAIGGTIPKGGATITGTPLFLVFDVETGERVQQCELGDQAEVNVVDIHWHEAGFAALVTNGSPGKGQLLFLRPGEKEPFFKDKKPANCQSITWRPDGKQFAVVGTNNGSNGNGRGMLKDGKYPNNHSPVHIYGV